MVLFGVSPYKESRGIYCPLWTFSFGISLKVLIRLNTRLLRRYTSSKERFPYAYKECFVPLSNWCGISLSSPFKAQRPRWHTTRCSTPFGAQPPRWHIAQCLALIPFVTAQAPSSLLADNNPSPKNVLFLSSTDMESHIFCFFFFLNF